MASIHAGPKPMFAQNKKRLIARVASKIPSFFTTAISTSLLPVISSSYSRGNLLYTKKKLKQALIISLGIGTLFTVIFMLIPEFLLKFIYDTNLGVNYIRIVCPFFLLHYIQGPLTSYLQAVNMADVAMRGTLVGSIIKNILLLTLPIFMGIWGFVVSSIVITLICFLRSISSDSSRAERSTQRA